MNAYGSQFHVSPFAPVDGFPVFKLLTALSAVALSNFGVNRAPGSPHIDAAQKQAFCLCAGRVARLQTCAPVLTALSSV